MTVFAHRSRGRPGYIYVAETDAYPGTVKIGMSGNVLARVGGLSGAGSMAVWRIHKAFAVTDMVRAEGLVKAVLAPYKSVKPGAERRRELFDVALATALDACEKAVAAVGAVAPSDARSVAVAGGSKLTTADLSWSSLLGAPIRFNRETKTLGDLMLMSLNDSRAAKRLEHLGVFCTRWCNDEPDFEVFLESGYPLQEWARVTGLGLPVGATITASFMIEKRV